VTEFLFLSHVLGSKTPAYGGGYPLKVIKTKSISDGDSCNEASVSLPLHLGTHVDAPLHFDTKGSSIDQLDPEYWICRRPWLLDVPVSTDGLLGLEALGGVTDGVPEDCDLLLLRTGFENIREQDPDRYATRGPVLGDDLATWLREMSSLKFVGLDTISASSLINRSMGRRTHATLLGASDRPAVLIVEDMHLSELASPPSEVWILPLRIVGADGAPVTVIAKI